MAGGKPTGELSGLCGHVAKPYTSVITNTWEQVLVGCYGGWRLKQCQGSSNWLSFPKVPGNHHLGNWTLKVISFPKSSLLVSEMRNLLHQSTRPASQENGEWPCMKEFI